MLLRSSLPRCPRSIVHDTFLLTKTMIPALRPLGSTYLSAVSRPSQTYKCRFDYFAADKPVISDIYVGYRKAAPPNTSNDRFRAAPAESPPRPCGVVFLPYLTSRIQHDCVQTHPAASFSLQHMRQTAVFHISPHSVWLL